jgi:hypothetical protein
MKSDLEVSWWFGSYFSKGWLKRVKSNSNPRVAGGPHPQSFEAFQFLPNAKKLATKESADNQYIPARQEIETYPL